MMGDGVRLLVTAAAAAAAAGLNRIEESSGALRETAVASISTMSRPEVLHQCKVVNVGCSVQVLAIVLRGCLRRAWD